MTPWVAIKKATVLIPSGPTHDALRKHLHIVLTDPTSTTGEVLIVSVCTIPSSNLYDSSCTLFPGEHQFISKHSYVAFRFSRIASAALLEAKVAAGEYVAKAPLSQQRFDDVVAGFLASPDVAPKFMRFFAATQTP